jgi:hypothetical protein
LATRSFTAAWAASQRIFSSTDQLEKVAQVIGGEVAANIHDKKNPWKNTCAVRMSYILNQSGLLIPAIPGKTKKGADRKNYFFRVKDVIAFLTIKWGAPEIVEYPASGGGPLAGKKGIILFEVQGWSDASGHATVFDGSSCYDHCYFNEPDAAYRTTKANYWALQ